MSEAKRPKPARASKFVAAGLIGGASLAITGALAAGVAPESSEPQGGTTIRRVVVSGTSTVQTSDQVVVVIGDPNTGAVSQATQTPAINTEPPAPAPAAKPQPPVARSEGS